MKHTGILFLVIFLSFPSLSLAQRSQNIRTSGTSVQVEALADSSLAFLYDGLKTATISFKDGSTSEVRLNYSILLDQFQVETRRGIYPFNPMGVVKMVVEGATFIHHPQEGYLEWVEQGNFPLYLKRLIRVSSTPLRKGAYSGVDHTSSIDVLTSISTQSSGDFDRHILLTNPSGQEMEINLRYDQYFLIGKGESLVKITNQRQLLRDFPEYRNQLREFIRREATNFSKPDDLVKLVKYLETL